MARNAREEERERMARLRKRAEMEPSDDEEGSDQSGGGEGSGDGGSDGEDDGWDDEEGDDQEAPTEPPNVEQVRAAGNCVTRTRARYCTSHAVCPSAASGISSGIAQDTVAATGAYHACDILLHICACLTDEHSLYCSALLLPAACTLKRITMRLPGGGIVFLQRYLT